MLPDSFNLIDVVCDIAFPQQTKFGDFFTKTKPWIHGQSKGHYCFFSNINQFLSLEVYPGNHVKTWIEKNMIDDRNIYFEIYLHADYASLYAKYNKICGNRLLAYLDIDSIPLGGRSAK